MKKLLSIMLTLVLLATTLIIPVVVNAEGATFTPVNIDFETYKNVDDTSTPKCTSVANIEKVDAVVTGGYCFEKTSSSVVTDEETNSSVYYICGGYQNIVANMQAKTVSAATDNRVRFYNTFANATAGKTYKVTFDIKMMASADEAVAQMSGVAQKKFKKLLDENGNEKTLASGETVTFDNTYTYTSISSYKDSILVGLMSAAHNGTHSDGCSATYNYSSEMYDNSTSKTVTLGDKKWHNVEYEVTITEDMIAQNALLFAVIGGGEYYIDNINIVELLTLTVVDGETTTTKNAYAGDVLVPMGELGTDVLYSSNANTYVPVTVMPETDTTVYVYRTGNIGFENYGEITNPTTTGAYQFRKGYQNRFHIMTDNTAYEGNNYMQYELSTRTDHLKMRSYSGNYGCYILDNTITDEQIANATDYEYVEAYYTENSPYFGRFKKVDASTVEDGVTKYEPVTGRRNYDNENYISVGKVDEIAPYRISFKYRVNTHSTRITFGVMQASDHTWSTQIDASKQTEATAKMNPENKTGEWLDGELIFTSQDIKNNNLTTHNQIYLCVWANRNNVADKANIDFDNITFEKLYPVNIIDGGTTTTKYFAEGEAIELDALETALGTDPVYSAKQDSYAAIPAVMGTEAVTVYVINRENLIGFENYYIYSSGTNDEQPSWPRLSIVETEDAVEGEKVLRYNLTLDVDHSKMRSGTKYILNEDITDAQIAACKAFTNTTDPTADDYRYKYVEARDSASSAVKRYEYVGTGGSYEPVTVRHDEEWDNDAMLAATEDGVTYKVTYSYRLNSASDIDVTIGFANACANPWGSSNNDTAKYFGKKVLTATDADGEWYTESFYFTAKKETANDGKNQSDHLFIYVTTADNKGYGTQLDIDNIVIEVVEKDNAATIDTNGDSTNDASYFAVDIAENEKTYKVEFDYATTTATTGSTPSNRKAPSFGFLTADADLNNIAYIGGANSAIYTAPTDLEAAQSYHATVIVTADMIDGANTLYGYVIGDTDDIKVYNVKVTALNSVVVNGGVSVLVDEVEQATNSQGLRFYFDYTTTNGGSNLVIGDTTYTVVERGFLFRNGNQGKVVFDGNNYKDSESVVTASTTDFEKYWKLEGQTVTFSTKITGFVDGATNTADYDDSLFVKGYVVIQDADGNQFTVYGKASNYSVNTAKALYEN